MKDQRTARAFALSVALLAFVLVGCGSESPTEKAFEGSGDDAPVVRNVTREMRGYSLVYADLVSAMTDEDIPASRRAVDSMFESLQTARDKTLDIDSTDLRQTLQDYISTMTKMATAADRIVVYYEDDAIAADAAVENDLAANFEDAVFAAQEADDNLLNRLMDRASPEEREALRESVRRLQEDFEQQVGG